jgi:VIT1/CCC1 family predicted Fe2+/Mn2+ transporter
MMEKLNPTTKSASEPATKPGPNPGSSESVWRENLQDERDGITLYEGLAALESDPKRADTLRAIAIAERKHAALWESKLSALGVAETYTPSARVRALLWLAGRIGPKAILPLVMQAEARDADKYQRQGADASALAADERLHRATLGALGKGVGAGSRLDIAGREGWHRGGQAGNLRAAVFGMNDGLVSNLSLVLGVAAAGSGHDTLVLTGVAGLLAGAFSMAVGEYVSVSSQRDVLNRQVELERRELIDAPEEEAEELAHLLQQKGLSREQALAASAEIMKNPEAALDTLVREELGLNPDDLGSPVGAAASSFGTFAVGACVPLLPFALLAGRAAVVVSAVLGGAVLAVVGGLLGFLSGASPLRSGLRMFGLAALAAGATTLIGTLLGSGLAR